MKKQTKTTSLSCPICGREAELYGSYGKWCVSCNSQKSHDLRTDWFTDKQQAINAWNRLVQQSVQTHRKSKQNIFLLSIDTSDGDQYAAFTTVEAAEKRVKAYTKEYKNEKWSRTNSQVWENGRGEFIDLVELTLDEHV
jgi:hypothetical protein